MSSVQTTRQPKGRPIGGEFASHARDESDIALPSDILDEVTAAPRTGLSDRQILEEAIKLSRIASFRVGLSKEDAEDIAQETVYSVLMTKSRNGGAAVDGGLIRVASRALVSRRVDTHKRHEDSKAFTRWKRETERLQNELGRHLTAKELDELAVQIREGWENPRHRPSVGFQYETKVLSHDSSRFLLDAMAQQESTVATGAEEAHYLADQVESNDVPKAEGRRRIWNAIAGDLGVAPAIEGLLTEANDPALKQVKNALTTARAFMRGAETPDVAALFLPFGALTGRQKAAIAEAIIDRHEVGHKLWLAARDFSRSE